MQLPDYCFGRRFCVCAEGKSDAAAMSWDISEVAFPEHFVLWELLVSLSPIDYRVATIRLAFGDQLPTDLATMNVLEPLIPGLGIDGPEPRFIALPPPYSMISLPLRTPLKPSGRRLVLEVVSAVAATGRVQVICVVSSIPTEAPDWLVSG